MRIDAYGMRHAAWKPDEMSARAEVDMNLNKERSFAERRAMGERMQRAEEEAHLLSDEEAKARAAAQRQQVLRSPGDQRRFDEAMERDNQLRQAMTASAMAYVGMRDRMLAKAQGVIKGSPGLLGLVSGEGPLFELLGPASDPTWRLGRGAPPQHWDVTTGGEFVRLVESSSGNLKSQWDGSRWLAQELARQLEAGRPERKKDTFVIRWVVPDPSLEEASIEMFDVPPDRLEPASRLEAVKRYHAAVRNEAYNALSSQPAPSPEASQGSRALLGLRGGRLVPVEAGSGTPTRPSPPPPAEPPRERFRLLLKKAASCAGLARSAASEQERQSNVAAAQQHHEDAARLLLEVSASELERAGRSEAGPALTVELLKLARDHVQSVGAGVAGALVKASKQAIDDQRRARR